MKAIDIEHLVRWAYRDELPKAHALDEHRDNQTSGYGAGWAKVSHYGTLGGVIQEPDLRNRFGLFPDLLAQAEPHRDAVAVAEAVSALAPLVVEMPAGWNPLTDMGDLGADGAYACARAAARLLTTDDDGLPRMRRTPADLVVRQAILGGAPAWEAAPPVRVPVTEYGRPKWFRRVALETAGPFGPVVEEIEMDGFDHKRRRPYPGAYQRVQLLPDPADAAYARAEYEVWHAALSLLASTLHGTLSAHVALSPARSGRPWEAPGVERRIIPSLLSAPLTAHLTRKNNAIAA